MEQIPVQGGGSGVQVYRGGDDATILVNSDVNNTIYLSHTNAVASNDPNSIPLSPQSFLTVKGKDDVYAACAPGLSAVVFRIAGGTGFFQSGITSGGFRLNIHGLFIYSTVIPALGTLVASVAPFGGVDPVGNVYVAGPAAYAGNVIAQLNADTQGAIVSGGTIGALNLASALTSVTDSAAIVDLVSKLTSGLGVPLVRITAGSLLVGNLLFLTPSGDVTGATDTAAVQSALNAGRFVYLLPGTFDFNATLNPKSLAMAVIEGSGWSTIMRWDSSIVSPFIGMGDTTQRTVVIRNCRIQNKGVTSVGTGILADYFTSQSIIDNVRIDGATNHPNIGVDYGLVSTNTHYCLLSNSRIQVDGANAIGVRYGGGATGAISNVFRNNRILISTTDATQTGIVVATRGIELDHPDIESGAGIGIDVQAAAFGCVIIAPYLEANGINLRLAAGVVAPVVVGGRIITGTPDIQDNGAIGPVYLGVSISGNISFSEIFREGWQSMATRGYQNGWLNAAGRVPGQYRIIGSPPNSIDLIGSLTVPVGVVAGQVIINLPNAYHPVNIQSVPARNLTNNLTVWLTLAAGGNMQFAGALASVAAGDVLDFRHTISLDA